MYKTYIKFQPIKFLFTESGILFNKMFQQRFSRLSEQKFSIGF